MNTTPGRKYQPSLDDVIKIEVVDLPLERKPGEGLYEWYFRSTSPVYMDMLTLEKELKNYLDARKTEFLLDRLQNFRKAFVNLTTGEIST